VEQDLMMEMTEMDLVADIEHVTDPAKIGNYGVAGTPALEVVSKPQLKALLSEAAAKHQ